MKTKNKAKVKKVTKPKRRKVVVKEPPPAPLPKQWYVLKVHPNREDKIEKALRRAILVEELEHVFGRTIVPTEKAVTVKAGKRVEKRERTYQGYVFVECAFTAESFMLVRGVEGVVGFVGSSSIHERPTPLQPHEIDRILAANAAEKDEAAPAAVVKVKIDLLVGDEVTFVAGVMKGMEGKVKSIDDSGDEPHLKVTAKMLGREVDIDALLWHVVKK